MSAWYYAIWFLTSAWAVGKLLLYKREPTATIAWLLFVTMFPFVGVLLFILFSPQRLERRAIKRRDEIRHFFHPVLLEKRDLQIPVEDQYVVQLTQKISDYAFTIGNEVKLLHDPALALQSMQDAIANAQNFIHLEYYIISSDEVTEQLFDSLIAARERGVEVRILYDAFGSLWLKRIYFSRLIEKGIKIRGFLPLTSPRLTFNFRNHRKILLIDGKTAFTGGTNLGRQYLGKRYDNQWRDSTVRVEGPACNQLQDVFAKDWHFTSQEELFEERYYPKPTTQGNASLQVLESGPDSAFLAMHQAFFLAMTGARKEILLSTPYFIPDGAVLTALAVSARRGISVKLLLPSKNDSRIVQFASRSFYDFLLDAGVEIYEYQPKILHSKLLVIDRKWTILGSANMDIRSFRLNFELNLMVYSSEMGNETAILFESDLKESRRIDKVKFANRPVYQVMAENACRLFSPVL